MVSMILIEALILKRNQSISWNKSFLTVISGNIVFLFSYTIISLFLIMPGFSLIPALVLAKMYIFSINPLGFLELLMVYSVAILPLILIAFYWTQNFSK